MSNTNVLEKVNRRARQIIRENPQISYRDAQKQAGLERREGISGRRKKPGKAAPRSKPGRVVGAKYRVRHVVEKIGAAQVSHTRKQLENELKAQRAWMLLAKDSATSKKARDKAARDLANNGRELKAITGSKSGSPPKYRKKRK